MADDSTWEKFKAIMNDGAPKGNTPVKELDSQKVAGFMKGFTGETEDKPETTAMSRRLKKLTGNY